MEQTKHASDGEQSCGGRSSLSWKVIKVPIMATSCRYNNQVKRAGKSTRVPDAEDAKLECPREQHVGGCRGQQGHRVHTERGQPSPGPVGRQIPSSR